MQTGTGVEGTQKCSFGQETNPKGSENDGAQTEKRSCWGRSVGHGPSILGKRDE